MRKYTLILYFNGEIKVCSTNDPDKFMTEKNRRYNDLQIIKVIKGDFRKKIRYFGTINYLRSIESFDKWKTLDLELKWNR